MQDAHYPDRARASFPALEGLLAASLIASCPLLDAVGIPRGISIAWGLIGLTALCAWSLLRAPDPGTMTVGPALSGMGLATVCLSPALIVGIFSAVYAGGHDGLACISAIAGGLFLALLLSSSIRAAGTASIPDYIDRRFGGIWTGRLAASILLLACLLFAAADLIALGMIGARFSGAPFELVVAGLVVLVAALASIGHRISFSRLQPMLWVIVTVALLLPLMVASFDRSGLPLGHFALGQTTFENTGLEQALLRRGLAEARTLKPLLTPFVSLDVPNTLGIVLALALGVAVMPFVLGRATGTGSVAVARRSLLWALLLFALVASAVPALAVLGRLEILSLIGKGAKLDALPAWMHGLGQLGALKICGAAVIDAETVTSACRKIARHPGVLRLQDLAIDPEALLMAIPAVIGSGFAVVAFLAAGLWAAGLGALGATLEASAEILSTHPRVSSAALGGRAAATRPLAIALSAGTAALFALARPADPLTLLVWAASLAGACVLPVLLVGALTKRIGPPAAITAMATGFGLCAAYIVCTRYFATTFHDLFAGFADIAPAAQRRFTDLQQAWLKLAPGPAKDAAWTAYDAHAQRIAGIWGLRSTAIALIAAPAALAALIVVGLPNLIRRKRTEP